MKKLILLLAFPTLALAEQCVLQDRTVSRGTVVIEERNNIRTEVVPSFSGGKKCMVSMTVRAQNAWHTAFGEYEWDGARPREEACAVAVKRAEDSVKERVGRSQVISEKMLVCRDQPDLVELKNINPGTTGQLNQFRPHPDRPNEFWYNGAPCRYILDSAWNGKTIRTWEGIICKIHDRQWVVVDKF